jgi:transcriptional regulator with XRE-family HTH domain
MPKLLVSAPPHPADRGAYLLYLMAQRGVPRNQLASLSGLTNTYIRDLEGDRILNVPRENLIFLGAALNLTLEEIEEVLRRFDRSPLSTADIPAFLSVAKRMHLSHALHPAHNVFYELILVANTQGAGRSVLVIDRPSGALRARGHRSWANRQVTDAHPIYLDLVEAVGDSRRETLHAALRNQPVEHYISLDGLHRYASESVADQERAWRRKQLRAMADLVREQARFQLYLTSQPPTFTYWLSFPKKAGKPTLVFEGQPASGLTKATTGRLTGFATTNPAVVNCFLEDLGQVQRAVIDEYRDRARLLDLLEALQR